MADKAFTVGPILTTTWNALPATIEVSQGDTVTASLDRPSGRKRISRTYALIDQDKVETMLHEHETQADCGSIKSYSNSLPSYQPNEDRHSTHAISTGDLERLVHAAGGGPGDFWRTWHQLGKTSEPRWIISSVVDGFSGPTVADTINRVLHASLAFALGCSGRISPEDIKNIMETV